MSVEISGGHYLGGMPAFDHKIVINGVTIGLSREDFQELTLKLNERIGEDYDKALTIYKKWDKGLSTARDFKKDIIKVFWDYDDDDDDLDTWLTRKQTKNIDSEQLSDILEKYSNFLGLE